MLNNTYLHWYEIKCYMILSYTLHNMCLCNIINIISISTHIYFIMLLQIVILLKKKKNIKYLLIFYSLLIFYLYIINNFIDIH